MILYRFNGKGISINYVVWVREKKFILGQQLTHNFSQMP